MTTTKLKLKWLEKRKAKLLYKVTLAFIKVKKELVFFLNHYTGKIDVLLKYLAQCVQTDDVISFLSLIDDCIQIAKTCDKNDEDAKRAIYFCTLIKLRLHLLSHFTLLWSNVTIKCPHCGFVQKLNFLYTNKLCELCGQIILKEIR